MTSKTSPKRVLVALWFVPIAIAVAVFFALIRWAKHQNPGITAAMTLVFGLFVLGHSLYIGHRASRGLDEVQVAQQRFANSQGWVWGGFATLLLLMVPPVMDALIHLVTALVSVRGDSSPEMIYRRALTMAFSFGATLVMLLQALAIVIAAVVWQRRMGGIGDAS